MAAHGSDKSYASHNGHHNYTTYYYELFKPVRDKRLRIFELGIGSNNPEIPSNMGKDGSPGASLRGWCDFFPNAEIFGADIDKTILFTSDRIKTYYCDQNSKESIKELWELQDLCDGFDIIIEDGMHNFYANKCFFENSIHKLNPDGVYIIEDLIITHLVHYIRQVREWELKYPDCSFKILPVPHTSNFYDNILLVVHRRPDA